MKLKILIFLIGLFPFICEAQVTISPEIGISYLPLKLYGATTENMSNRIDYLIGISGRFPIHKYWIIDTRISFINREDLRWTDLCTCPGYLYTDFRHYDINIDFSLNKKKNKYLLGLGPTITMKNEEWEEFGLPIFEGESINGHNLYLFGINSNISYILPFNLTLKIQYIGYLNEIKSYYKIVGRNRLDFTISYSFSSKNNR